MFWDIMLEELLEVHESDENEHETLAFVDGLLIMIQENSRVAAKRKANSLLETLRAWYARTKRTPPVS